MVLVGQLVFSACLILISTKFSKIDCKTALWQWKCDSSTGLCARSPATNQSSQDSYPTVETCRLICGPFGALWPQPQVITKFTRELTKLSPKLLAEFENSVPDGDALDFINKNLKLFNDSLNRLDYNCQSAANRLVIKVTVDSDSVKLDWATNESYALELKFDETNHLVLTEIKAKTVFGARHALETLRQLIDVYPSNGDVCLVTVKAIRVVDKPVFAHRGLLLDTGRNFQTVEAIKLHIDAMAASKLNVLHWHATDSQSFPLELPSLPNMTRFGAYSAQQTYSPDAVKDLYAYAKLRGVRIILEIDAPSHSGNGWQWGPDAGLGNLAVCVNQSPYRQYCIQPPCGQLNPVNPNLYRILGQLYKDIVSYQPPGEVFHMGGDEVFIPCWNSTKEIIDYFGSKPRTEETFLDFWADFQDKALGAYDSAVGNTATPIMLWTSHITQPDVIEKYLSKSRYVIQTWVPAGDSLPSDLLRLGYRLVVSTKDAWYLDHGFWGTTQYHNWRVVYNNKLPGSGGNLTLGGEVCMWGELVDSGSVMPRTWPRAAAAAERLWTNPETKDGAAEPRFYRHRERLVGLGVQAEVLAPRWCYQNEGQCT